MEQQYDGEIVIDPRNYAGLNSSRDTWDSDDDEMKDGEEAKIITSKDGEEAPYLRKAKKWALYDKINPKKHSELTRHHYFLFTRQIYGFALKEKKWSMLNAIIYGLQG